MAELKKVCVSASEGASYVSSECLKVVVGGREYGERTFFVHEDLIISRSGFFRSCMNGEWNTAVDRKVTLLDIEPDTFEMYLQLIYSGTIEGNHIFIPSLRTYDDLAQVYVLAERFIDPKSKNLIIHGFFEMMHIENYYKWYSYPGPSTINIIYEGTSNFECPARRLLVDINCEFGGVDWLKDKDLPKDFWHELSIALMERVRSGKSSSSEPIPVAVINKYLEEE